MWIVFAVLAAIIALVLGLLLAPVSIIVKKPNGGPFSFDVKILGFKLKEPVDKPRKKKKKKKKKDGSVADTIKKAAGLDRFNPKDIKEDLKAKGFFDTASRTFEIVCDLVSTVGSALGHVRAKRFLVNIVCAEDDAAETAILHGRCCAVVYPVVGFIGSVIKMPKRKAKVNISSDFRSGKGYFDLNLKLTVRVLWVLVAGLKIIIAQTSKSTRAKLESGTKPQNINQKKSR